MATKKTRTLEIRQLDQLIAHPLQASFFPNLSDFDLRGLADDIEQRGLQHAIELMPAGNAAGLPADTILRGHQRRRAQLLRGLAGAAVRPFQKSAGKSRIK